MTMKENIQKEKRYITTVPITTSIRRRWKIFLCVCMCRNGEKYEPFSRQVGRWERCGTGGKFVCIHFSSLTLCALFSSLHWDANNVIHDKRDNTLLCWMIHHLTLNATLTLVRKRYQCWIPSFATSSEIFLSLALWYGVTRPFNFHVFSSSIAQRRI